MRDKCANPLHTDRMRPAPMPALPRLPKNSSEAAPGALLDNAKTTSCRRGAKAGVRLIAIVAAAVAALAGCSNRDCAYYGGADANTRCVVVGPSPINGGQ